MFFKALGHRSFSFLWIGQTTSRLGDSLYQLALAWWVLQKTGSATIMGLTLAFSFAPLVIFLLIGGVAVDRFSRKYLMFFSDLIRGILMIVMMFLALNGRLEIWHIYVLSLIFGFVSAFFQPAYSAVLPDLLPPEDLFSANSLTNISRQLSEIIGPGLAAVLINSVGIAGIFAINAASFIIGAICLLFVSIPTLRKTEKHPRFFIEIKQGINFVFSVPWLWITIVVFSTINIFVPGVFKATIPALVKETFNNDAYKLGILYIMAAVGSALISFPLGSMKKFRWRGLVAYIATFCSGLSVFFWGLTTDFTIIAIFMILHGVSVAIFSLIWNNTVQEMVPHNMLGRVYSVDMLGSYGLLPVGFGLMGWLTDITSPSFIFIISGIFTMLLSGLIMLHPAIRKLD